MISHHFPLTPCSPCDAPVSVWFLCVDASLVSAGLALLSRVDSAGKPACEKCGRRLSRCKGKKHTHGAGHICQDCYDKLRGKRKGSFSASSSCCSSTDGVAPTPKKKRRTASDPGSHTDTTADITTSTHAQGRALRSSCSSLPTPSGSPTLSEWNVSALLLQLSSH